MTPPPLLPGLLIAALFVADVVVSRQWPVAPDLALLLFGGLATGQLTLVTAWSVWGVAPWLPRLLAPVALAAWLSRPLGAATAGRWPEWFLLLTLFAALVALPLRCVRCAASRARTDEAAPEDTRGARRKFQFSLAGFFSWTTLIGVACALRDNLAFPWAHRREVGVYGVCLAAVAVGAWWASAARPASAPGRVGPRAAGLTLLCLLAGGIMHAATGVRHLAFFTVLALVEAVVVCGGMQVWGGGAGTASHASAAGGASEGIARTGRHFAPDADHAARGTRGSRVPERLRAAGDG